ncbi:hypothetical protein Tco_0774701 [Tanacetum coccineum]|uniref:Reverse transcriptase domain-containing protein n=1 Tax=Tanacetum coccineum TaxID=301880 RepID=A0ABQ4ZSS6_9ASTR
MDKTLTSLPLTPSSHDTSTLAIHGTITYIKGCDDLVIRAPMAPALKDWSSKPAIAVLTHGFFVLDIVKDDKVLIILGRPMLATAYVRIDVFSKKILLEVGGEKIMFNANEGIPLLSVTSVCAINNFQVPNGFEEQENLEEFLTNDEINVDLGDFLELDDLLPGNNVEPFGILSYSKSEMRIGPEDFSGNLEDLLDEQALQF